MNFQISSRLTSLKVLVTNPLSPAAQLIITKILDGTVFGSYQQIDLILLVYSNERPAALEYRLELRCCAFSCMNSIEISSDLPSFFDADVFCFISNLKNPNCIDFENIDNDTFDALYLIIKIAHNLILPEEETESEKEAKSKKKNESKPRKKLIFADGLVALDILKTFSQNLPSTIFLCPTPLQGIASTILAEYLKVECSELNHMHIWAANDAVLHVEVDKPYILKDSQHDQTPCDWDKIGKDRLRYLKLDHTQFNEAWMKGDYIKKVATASSNNSYGVIARAGVYTALLKLVWSVRAGDDDEKVHRNMGVISDGSLGTIKGCPVILPVFLNEDNWTASLRYEETYHLRQEITRIKNTVIEHHDKLVRYCKKFLKDNIINNAFIPSEDSASVSMGQRSRRMF